MVEHLYVVLLNRVLVDVVEVVYCILVAVVDMVVDILVDSLGVGADNTVAVAGGGAQKCPGSGRQPGPDNPGVGATSPAASGDAAGKDWRHG